jgi:beta-1,4-mannosyltransferase
MPFAYHPQTPPAVPVLMIVKIASLLRGSKMIIDWHNTGYSLLGLSLGQRHPAVWAYKKY